MIKENWIKAKMKFTLRGKEHELPCKVSGGGLRLLAVKEDNSKTIRELLNESVAEGWKMSKVISKGFLSSTWDTRVAHSFKEVSKLTKEGFTLDENLGLLVMRILLEYEK